MSEMNGVVLSSVYNTLWVVSGTEAATSQMVEMMAKLQAL